MTKMAIQKDVKFPLSVRINLRDGAKVELFGLLNFEEMKLRSWLVMLKKLGKCNANAMEMPCHLPPLFYGHAVIASKHGDQHYKFGTHQNLMNMWFSFHSR